MSRGGAQGSLEYIIIIGGVIIMAIATYFLLRGFAQTTGEGTTETIGVAGDKFRLELENLGRSETRFYIKKWGSHPLLSRITLNNTGSPTTTDITLNNLTEYGIDLDEVQFAYNDSGAVESLEKTVYGPTITFTTPLLPSGTSEILLFHNNSSALKLDNLNYTSSDPDVKIINGNSPEESPDTTPPTIVIALTAYGSSGSVKDADIQVTVKDANSSITEVYYSMDNSPYFKADNLFYGYEDIILEGHPEDHSYDSGSETIHLIVTVPNEANHTVRVLARDEYGNEGLEEENVSIRVAPEMVACLLIVFYNGDSEFNVSFSGPGGNDTGRIELPLDASVTSASLGLAGVETASEFNFSEREYYAAGEGPYGIISGDFNNDDNLDVVVSNSVSDNFSYFEGNGDGTFQPKADYATGNNPGQILAEDFDKDGNLDLIIKIFIPPSYFSYFEGDGNGTFLNTANYSTGGIGGIYAGDFNNDGNLDVAASNNGGNTFSYSAGLGDGTFNASVNRATGWYTWPLDGGDFNKDGNLDLITASANLPETFYYVQGNGDGTFQSKQAYSTGEESFDIFAGDFNNDGNLDAILPDLMQDRFSYLEGNGDGTFNITSSYPTGSDPCGILGGDFNNDGSLDVVVSNCDSNVLTYFEGDGDGVFMNTANFTTGGRPRGMHTGDFDGDGYLDLVVAELNGDTFSYFENDMTYNYATNPGLDIGSDGDIEWTYAGEFNISDTFSGTSFVSELNSLLPDCSCLGCTVSGGGENCTIAFNFTSDTGGILELSELEINYTRPE